MIGGRDLLVLVAPRFRGTPSAFLLKRSLLAKCEGLLGQGTGDRTVLLGAGLLGIWGTAACSA